MSTQQERLKNVKSVIAVASGKGGVGKSTVAANLACALQKIGKKVGLLDADIYGPSQHIMMGLKDATPVVSETKKILPIEKFGMEIVSFGFFIKPDEAVVWRGPLIGRMIQQFLDDVNWGELDVLVVDMPPGTGDAQLTLTQLLAVTGAVIVSTPQDIALADAIKGISMFQKVNVDILGVVENMSTFVCPHCSHETPIFDKDGGSKKAKEMKVPFLGSVPLELETRQGGDSGTPIVLGMPDSPQAKRFIDMAYKVSDAISNILKNAPAKHPIAPQASQTASHGDPKAFEV